ncbi:tRNA (adenosine(37)-N6)-dimethylallyltransferase MiaA [Planococcus lenghuensis]|uniref:tRNA dimethylallyltransferase n=1 Tax=Planococcus lenghuensis TaxID=2213202 RepID=A0A1Q2KZS0_9BACL|nr:tRNA (adenosine(37)-N6)-dimethylallyltransferase MiaA [Planococcus lenghuensis]AQQ53688.1 tRNA (adenosine(37)-N6)-dimethylallyltransferase MiaA [Planococcus lenghuensis]
MPDVLAIVGPTASGKTALSLALANRLGGEIISGDSMQVYKGLDVGTAKISPDEMAGIPHHLLDILDPAESFSVADYQRLVREKIDEIHSRGKLPIIVGGTGLYIQAVLFDYRFAEDKTDPALREALYEELEQKGPAHMHKKLTGLDPDTAIHPNNTRRVLRALEILLTGGRPETTKGNVPLYNEAIIGLDLPRSILYERIDFRVDDMLANGLLQEAEMLVDRKLTAAQAAKAIGYKELFPYLSGEQQLEEAIRLLKKNSRNYAKRQFTYFRNKLPVYWTDALQPTEKIVAEVEGFLKENRRSSRISMIEAQKEAEKN